MVSVGLGIGWTWRGTLIVGYTDADSSDLMPGDIAIMINAFNMDMPFDQFITEQLAGDDDTRRWTISQQLMRNVLRLPVSCVWHLMVREVLWQTSCRHDTMADTIRIVASSFWG